MWTLRQRNVCKKIGIVIPVEVLQKTAILETARILRSVLDIKLRRPRN